MEQNALSQERLQVPVAEPHSSVPKDILGHAQICRHGQRHKFFFPSTPSHRFLFYNWKRDGLGRSLWCWDSWCHLCSHPRLWRFTYSGCAFMKRCIQHQLIVQWSWLFKLSSWELSLGITTVIPKEKWQFHIFQNPQYIKYFCFL